MLQVHFQVDPTDRRQLGVLLAAMNAVADFLMHATPSVAEHRGPAVPPAASFGAGQGMPMQGQPMPGAPAPAPAPAASKTRTRKPKDGAPLPGQTELPMGQPMPPGQPPYVPGPPQMQVMPPQQQWPQQQPPMQHTLGGNGAEAEPDIKTQLHNALRDFATHFGSNALQGLLIAFGVDKRSDLPLARAEEIFHYIRAAYAQQQQAQGPVA